MENNINKVLGRLSNVGNPIFLLKMLQDIRRYIKRHFGDYPTSHEYNTIYFDIEGKIYLIENMLVTKVATLPDKANLINLSEQALYKIAHLLGVKNDEMMISNLLKEMRSIKNIKKYQDLLEVGDASFSTNLTSNQFALIVLNQIRKN
ncbi:hypothetical protein [Lactococcus lactis]|jgi:hypothetical protein|uniref:hypothetical protein n=1 Tax=Lactococcus lactis TaxID=1358 RepID=UPI00241740A3|nr:hypothetical protein [Lactococcus lactis]MDG4956416.1 hypothetical protein [Lactococcus lactis]